MRTRCLAGALCLVAAALMLTACSKEYKEQQAALKYMAVVPPPDVPSSVAAFARTYLPQATITKVEQLKFEYTPQQVYYRIYYTDRNGRNAVLDFNPANYDDTVQAASQEAARQEQERQQMH